MRKTSDLKVIAVVNDWLDGFDLRDIESRQGVSRSTASDIIKDFCQQYPTIPALRDLNTNVMKTGIPVTKASGAILTLDQLKSSRLTVSDVDRCLQFLNRYAPKEKEALEAGIKIWNLEIQTGKPYHTIVADANAAVSERGMALQRKKEIEAEIDKYADILPQYEILSSLKAKLGIHGIGIQDLDSFIDHNLRLRQLKFDPSTAEYLATELNNINLTPQESVVELSRLIVKGRNIVESIANLDTDLKKYTTYCNQEKAGIEYELGNYNSSLQATKDELSKKQKELSGIKDEIEEMRRLHDSEMEKLTAERNRLSEEIIEKQSEISSLDENLKKNKKELDEINALVDNKEKLQSLVSLLERPDRKIEEKKWLELTLLLVGSLKSQYSFYIPTFQKQDFKFSLDSLDKIIKGQLSFDREISG